MTRANNMISDDGNGNGNDTRGGGGGGFHPSSFLKGMVFAATLVIIVLVNAASEFRVLRHRLPAEQRDLKHAKPEPGPGAAAGATATTTTTTTSISSSSFLPEEPPPPGPMCLGLGDDEELDRMLSRYDLVYVLTHAKSGSSTMKFFAKDCTGLHSEHNEVYGSVLYTSKKTQNFLRREFTVPPFVTSRLVNDKMFMRLTQNAITNSLVIYIHREDTERFKSGIRQVATGKTFAGRDVIDEEEMFGIVAEKRGEIGLTGNVILTCPVYESIDENQSNVVFVNIAKMDGLLRLLKKHHCPNYKDRGHVNEGGNKEIKKVRLGGGGGDEQPNLVELDDWIEAKGHLLEHAFELKSEASCQGTTRSMEEKLFACPDQTYWYSGLEFRSPPSAAAGPW